MFKRCLPLVIAVAVAALVSASPAIASSPFGFQSFEASLGGDTQAGSHPAALTVSFAFNSALNGGGDLEPLGGEADDLEFQLPPGLIGNPTAVPQCTRQQLDEKPFEGGLPRRYSGRRQPDRLINGGGPLKVRQSLAQCSTWSRPLGFRPYSPRRRPRIRVSSNPACAAAGTMASRCTPKSSRRWQSSVTPPRSRVSRAGRRS